jgi:hypothetical protein
VPAFGRRYGAALGVGSVAVASFGVALGLHLSIESTCKPGCDPALEDRARAVYALDAIGAAAVATDVVLWIVAARRGSPARAAAPPSGAAF